MPFEQTFHPQYRDADPDGLIGLKGAMHYFQDIHTWFMHSMHKGNDELPEKYGSAWVYTRYLVTLSRKIDYTDTITLSAWMEPYRQPVLVNINMLLRQRIHKLRSFEIQPRIYHDIRLRRSDEYRVRIISRLKEKNIQPRHRPGVGRLPRRILFASAQKQQDRRSDRSEPYQYTPSVYIYQPAFICATHMVLYNYTYYKRVCVKKYTFFCEK